MDLPRDTYWIAAGETLAVIQEYRKDHQVWASAWREKAKQVMEQLGAIDANVFGELRFAQIPDLRAWRKVTRRGKTWWKVRVTKDGRPVPGGKERRALLKTIESEQPEWEKYAQRVRPLSQTTRRDGSVGWCYLGPIGYRKLGDVFVVTAPHAYPSEPAPLGCTQRLEHWEVEKLRFEAAQKNPGEENEP